MTKEIILKAIEKNILATEIQDLIHRSKFIDERICGEVEFWDKYKNVSYCCGTLPQGKSNSEQDLMKTDGSVHQTLDKSTVLTVLENLSHTSPELTSSDSSAHDPDKLQLNKNYLQLSLFPTVKHSVKLMCQ